MRRVRLLRAALIAPLTAPVAYVGLLMGQTALGSILGKYSGVWLGSADAFLLIVLAGSALAYAATIIAGLPIVLMLRQAGMLRLGPVAGLSGGIGLLMSQLLRPHLRSDLLSVPFTWWHGVTIGVVTGVVFWLIMSSAAARDASTTCQPDP